MVPATEEEAEKLKKIKVGQALSCEIKQMRNYKYLQKFMCMVRVGFDAFEPVDNLHKGVAIEKEIEQFRKDITIMAGFYYAVPSVNGGLRLKAKSISFANMKEEEFQSLYNAFCNVLLKKVLHNYTRPDLDQVVEQLIRF